MTTRSRNIKLALVLVMGGALVLVTSMFVMYRRGSEEVKNIVASAKPDAEIAISRVRHVATKEGKTEWRLDADSAYLADQRAQAVFESPAITFFTADREEVYLTAREGVVETDSNNIQVHGDVVLKSEDYRVETQSLDYKHADRVFSSNVPVRINGAEFDLEADSASFDLKTNTMKFKGNIQGSFGDGISL